jgi:large subunit ribosomal protein L29
MKFSEIKDLTVDELRKKDTALKQDYFMLKMKNSLGQLANPLSIRAARKNIAKLKTAINQKLAK